MGGALMGGGGKQYSQEHPWVTEAKRRTFAETWDVQNQRSKEGYYYRPEREWMEASQAKLRGDNSEEIQWYDEQKYGGNWEAGYQEEKTAAVDKYWGKVKEHLTAISEAAGRDSTTAKQDAEVLTDYSGSKAEVAARQSSISSDTAGQGATSPGGVGEAQKPEALAPAASTKEKTVTVLTSPSGVEGHDVPKRKTLLGG